MNSFFATLQQLGPARLGIMGAILMGLLMFFVFISLRISTPEMKLLYSDLSTIDSGAVAAKLEESQIPFEISADGSRIVVPGNEVGKARMLLAAAGLPNGGSMGYEIFDEQSSFGTTNFVQNINQVRALEGELARTIGALDSIRSARVHIVLPQRELFSRESKAASASVFIGVRPGANLEKQQILSIQSLVASAVPNLKASSVSIIDSNGNLLAKGGDEEADALSLKAEEMRRNYETRLASRIEEQVSRVVGYGKVTAIVTAAMNFDRTRTDEEIFNPEGQVARSIQTIQENSTEQEGGAQDVTVANNLPGVGGDLLNDNQSTANSNRNEEITNFEITKTVRSTVRDGGEIDRLAVSVLLDGTYTTDAEGVKTYVPRTQEEMDKIASMVKTAIGYNEDRGDTFEITNLQFAQIDTNEDFVDDSMLFGFQKSDLIDAAEIVIVAIMVVLVVLLVLQPMVGKLMAVDLRQPQDDLLTADLLPPSLSNPALAAPTGSHPDEIGGSDSPADETMIDIAGIEGKVKASTVKKVEEIVENYPMETVSVIRSWMSQES